LDGAGATGRRLYYFAQDLSDEGLGAAPEFRRLLGRQDGFNVYLKSASYLLHTPEFATLRELLLGSGRTILQDDSGIPLRDFDRERFDLRFFGTYEQTLPAYRQWFQEELRAIYAAGGVEPLGFAIGYHSQIGGSCLIWAERRPDPPDWPQFRGPTGDGMARQADLPLTWSEDTNIAWKTAIPGRGWSSPIVHRGKVWLTAAREEERSLRAVAVDLESGEILHDVEVFRPPAWRGNHAENSYASPTPVAAAGRVYVHFGAYGTACLDAADAAVVWKSRPFDFDHEHGPGSSPIVYRDLLIVNFDGAAERFVAAFDRETGELEWKAPRSVELVDHEYAFSTPLVVEHRGAAQVVSPGSGQVSAYDPLTGKEIWRVRHGGHSAVPRPVAGLGRVFVDTGYMKPHLLAIEPGGRGDVTDTHVVWSYHWQVPANPSPLLIGERLFFTNDWGNATWLDARTGEDVWRQRLGGRHYASPIYARGRIYTFDVDGETRVIAAEDEFRELARNRLDGGFRASPAVAGEALILRTETSLYRIEERPKTGP
jgi:outer membrane protein assembly factor BamB